MRNRAIWCSLAVIAAFAAGSSGSVAVAADPARPSREQQAAAKASGVPVQITNSTGMKLMFIPAGEFMVGSHESAPDAAASFNENYGYGRSMADHFKPEHPQHKVRITGPFYLGTHEVTRGQFRQFVNDTGYKTDAEKGERPGGMGWDPLKGIFKYNKDYSWRNSGFEQTDELRS